MKRFRLPLIILIVVAGLVIVKIKFLSSPDGAPAAGPGKTSAKQPPLPVSAVIAHPESVENKIFSTGTIISNKEIDLQTEVSGKIVRLNIREGARIPRGALLVKLNDSELRAQMLKLKLQLVLDMEKEERAKKLLDINGISREDYEVLQSQINTTRAEMDLIRAQTAKTELRAPFSGVIGFMNVNEGSYVSTGTKIATLQQIDPLKLDFSVPEKYSRVVRLGDIIRFTLQGSDKTYQGRVYAIDPNIDVQTRNVSVRALCPNADARILPGSFAKVQIDLQKIPRTIMIPTQALVPVLKGYKVFVCRDGRAKDTVVEIGIRTDQKVQITDGLMDGDTVLTSGMMMLKPEAQITVTIEN